ncbi:MAG: TPR repeat protein, partial [Brevundimonas sp.]|uniref:tetratricopeptide repeat protein n=1 Tax=Brevundimonas sp. TaxID=1871086 RepID=UPI0039E6B0E8
MMRGLVQMVCVSLLSLVVSTAAQAQSASRSYDQGMRAYRAQDYAAARDHLRSACDLAHGQACFNYGVMAYRGLYGEPDPVHARWLYGRSCEFGHMPGCYNQANMLSAGEGGDTDEAAAR